MASIYECANCREWVCGGAYFPSDAPKDPSGRVDRDYADSNPTKFCSAECRAEKEK